MNLVATRLLKVGSRVFKRNLSLEVKMNIILSSDEVNHPYCIHGPTLLFSKKDTKRNSSRKFFACSANRDRKFCNFFHWFDEAITKEKRQAWIQQANRHTESLKMDMLRQRQEKLKQRLPGAQFKFCRKCSLLLSPDEWANHTKHGFLENINSKQITEPTSFLLPLEEKKTNAQYFFSGKCVQFVVDSLKSFNFKKLLCIGTPRIYEYVSKNEKDVSALFMDIDHRYAQFYNPKDFLLYNLFNHYFFEGPSAGEAFKGFLCGPEDVAVIIDPPFGGMIDAIAHTLQKISYCKGLTSLIPLVLFFPYFNEDRILHSMPSLKMLDYKVNYTNHTAFKEGGMKQGSPVRIFTNLDASKFYLPSDDGYRFCDICQRYVSKENSHCLECDACTSKDGRPYNHCKECGLCFKSSWKHCDVCKRCALPDHTCGSLQEGPTTCHTCHNPGHKKRECTDKNQNRSLKRKR